MVMCCYVLVCVYECVARSQCVYLCPCTSVSLFMGVGWVVMDDG